MTATLRPRRALLSVSDTQGLGDFAKALVGHGVALIATGSTRAYLASQGIKAQAAEDLTGFAAMMDGRVKTLHPAIHAAILARRDNPDDMRALADNGFAPIDIVCVGFYPFQSRPAIETIDVGGPTMVRAAAKNHAFVVCASAPEDYATILADLADLAEREGGISEATRRMLAARAFARLAAYDASVAAFLAQDAGGIAPPVVGARLAALRYGENPHQDAVLFARGDESTGAARARQVQGRALGYNALLDCDAAWRLAGDCVAGAAGAVVCVGIKHATPCGVAVAATAATAYCAARDADPESIFGGVVALSAPLDRACAEAMRELFLESVIAPDADARALALLAEARPNLRVLLTGHPPRPTPGVDLITLEGAALAQTRDCDPIDSASLVHVAGPALAAQTREDLAFALRVARSARSNAVVIARAQQTLGIGCGQTSRVQAAREAAARAERHDLRDAVRGMAVAASDGFFPFPDAMEMLITAGVQAIVAPSGSRNDAQVAKRAEALGVSFAHAPRRLFRH